MPSKRYYWQHKEKCIEESLKWRKENWERYLETARELSKTEKSKATKKKWREANPDKVRQWDKDWVENHRERKNELVAKYRVNNREEINERQKQCRKDNPERWKVYDQKHYNKRERNLGFNPLNKSFEDSEGHHINKNDVIYVPKEIHQSISHCLETGKNMNKINEIAMNYI